jgi:hypothetical protein
MTSLGRIAIGIPSFYERNIDIAASEQLSFPPIIQFPFQIAARQPDS